MPQRFLRPGIRTSDRMNSVSFKAQALFVKLLTIVDDFGRCDGRPAVICGECFSVWNDLNPDDVVNPQETAALCQQLSDKKLVEFYESEGKKIAQLSQWQERARSDRSKWPDRNENPLRNPAESCGILPPSVLAISHKPSPSVSEQSPGASAHVIEEIYQAYPVKVGKPKAIAAIKTQCRSTSPEKLLVLTRKYAEARNGNLDYVPHPATWFNQQRFNDDPKTWEPRSDNGAHKIARPATLNFQP